MDARARALADLLCFFAGTDEESAAGEPALVTLGDAMDGRGLKKKHPMTTVATAPRGTSARAPGSDKRNVLRADGERPMNSRDVSWFEGGKSSSTVSH